jgi:hypothetical protein
MENPIQILLSLPYVQLLENNQVEQTGFLMYSVVYVTTLQTKIELVLD